MSEHPERDAQHGHSEAAAGNTARGSGGPEPEDIRFFGRTWLHHDGGYALRRVGATVGSLAVTAASCGVLVFAYQGLAIADIGSFVGLLVIVMFALAGAIAFRMTWQNFKQRPEDPGREEALRSIKAIGFVGSLVAYFLRSLTEAPGEGLRRAEYERAVTQYERRKKTRTGNPAGRRSGKPKNAQRR